MDELQIMRAMRNLLGRSRSDGNEAYIWVRCDQWLHERIRTLENPPTPPTDQTASADVRQLVPGARIADKKPEASEPRK